MDHSSWKRIVSPDQRSQVRQASSQPLASSDLSQRLQESLVRMPLTFEANQGQVDKRVKFISRGLGHTLFLTPREAVIARRVTLNLPEADPAVAPLDFYFNRAEGISVVSKAPSAAI